MKEMQGIKDILKRKLNECEKVRRRIEKSLRCAPEGILIQSQSNGVVQYYHKTDSSQNKGTYIKKQNKKLIASLAQKEYDLALLKVVEKQEKQIEKILNQLPEKDLQDVYKELPEGKRMFVKPHILTDEQYIEWWQQVQYKGNPYKSEYPMQKTERGEMVRSKTEKILADKLYAMGIPYRYEYPLRLQNGHIIYPDFTLLKTGTKEECYLEHFGMMDHPEYNEKAIKKIQEYARNEIYPGKQLLVTFETSTTPLDMDLTEQMINNLLPQSAWEYRASERPHR